MSELLPCPFCGSSNVAHGLFADDEMFVRCLACDTCGPFVTVPEHTMEMHRYIESAYSMWNRRAAPEHAAPQENKAGTASEGAGFKAPDSGAELVAADSLSRSLPNNPVGAAPPSVSPQAPTAIDYTAPSAASSQEGVGQGGTAEGADWVRIDQIREIAENNAVDFIGQTDRVLIADRLEEILRYVTKLSAAHRPDAGEEIEDEVDCPIHGVMKGTICPRC